MQHPSPSDIKPLHTGQLSVSGVGRVGSYTSAVRGKRCRARQYWCIKEFEKRPSPGPNQFNERTDIGKFKTKKEATEYLIAIADAHNCWTSSRNLIEYISIDLTLPKQ